MTDGNYVDGSVWFYAPNKVAPIIFAVAFAITGAWHLWQCTRFDSWKITGLHPFTCFIFAAGFVCRALGAWDYEDANVYIASTVLIYASPPLLELANYHVLGRILYYVPYNAPMHPGRTLTTFGMMSMVVEVLNGLGVAWIAAPGVDAKLVDVGHGFLQASLVIQIVVIVIFVSIAVMFHLSCAKAGVLTRRTKGPLITMYLSSLLILVRCVYRTVEHFSSKPMHAGDGTTTEELNSMNPIMRYEWFFYVFEASLMVLNEYLWNLRHPRHYLPQDYHIYLAQDGVTELRGPGWDDGRSFMATLCDPFGWMDRSGKSKPAFWETNGLSKLNSNPSARLSPASTGRMPGWGPRR